MGDDEDEYGQPLETISATPPIMDGYFTEPDDDFQWLVRTYSLGPANIECEVFKVIGLFTPATVSDDAVMGDHLVFAKRPVPGPATMFLAMCCTAGANPVGVPYWQNFRELGATRSHNWLRSQAEAKQFLVDFHTNENLRARLMPEEYN